MRPLKVSRAVRVITMSQVSTSGAGPAVLSKLAVQDDLATRRLVSVPLVGLDQHRALRAVWLGGRTLPAGAARHLIAHIATLR